MSNISEILEKYKDSRTMEFAIYDAFYQAARRFANTLIAEDFQSVVDGSDIANRAMKSTLSELAQGKITNATSDDFMRLLFQVVRTKVVDEIRYHDRAMRSPKQSIPLEPNLTPEQASTDPTVKAVMDELSASVVVKLLQRHDGEDKNPLRVYIAVMGALYDVPSGEIHSTLKKSFPTHNVPALRTVQKQKKEDKAFFEALIRNESALDDD